MDEDGSSGDPAQTPPPTPRRGGSQKRQRARMIGVPCTDAEFAAITKAAQAAGLSAAAFLRRQALGAPGPRSIRLPHPDKQELVRIHAAIGSWARTSTSSPATPT